LPKKFTRNKQSKIDAIVQATVSLIEEKGYSGFVVDEIPSRAGLSIGTVYRYFPKGKSDILHEIITRNNRILLELISNDDTGDGTFSDFWRRVLTSYLRGHKEGLFSLTAMEYTYSGDSQFTEILAPIVSEFFEKLVNRIHGLETFPHLSKRDLYSRVAMSFGFVGLFVKGYTKNPHFFKSEERLIEYLLDVSIITFEMIL
jgi:AcrR family transcriptional regulator